MYTASTSTHIQNTRWVCQIKGTGEDNKLMMHTVLDGSKPCGPFINPLAVQPLNRPLHACLTTEEVIFAKWQKTGEKGLGHGKCFFVYRHSANANRTCQSEKKKECGLGFVGKYLPSYLLRERWLERPHVPCDRFFDVCICRNFPCVHALSCVLRDCCRVIVSLSCVLREFYHVYHHCQCFF
jgi:hypothetical protein